MLTAFADGVWYDTGPVRIVGTRLTVTMTVLRIEAGGLLVHSPLPLTPERRAEVSALGPIQHLYAPNTFHHRWIGEWRSAFPDARLHAPEALANKRKDLSIDRFHDRPGEPAFSSLVAEVPIEGFRLVETALVHGPGRTLVVTDLVHNVGRPTDPWTKLYSSLMGFYDRVALSRALRWTAFSDRGAARRSVDRLLAHDFDGLIVGHGTPIPVAGREAFAQATSWLPAATALTRRVRSKGSASFSAKPCG
jgi:hypothetical protein